jgi:tRNA pseudouridine13 synthase
MVKREFVQKHKPLDFQFFQNENDFIVEENPIEFSNRGNFIIAKIKKKNLGTWDLIEKLSKQLKIYENEIGYAGLKDKNATTTQYISIPKKYSKELKKFKAKNIEILQTTLHNSKLNIGDLISNSFKINLHEVKIEDIGKIEKIINQIAKIGMPNYFGFQRFGKEADLNIKKAKSLVYEDLVIKDKKIAKMLISLYQSNFFNAWLVKRLNLSQKEFKLLKGDVFRNTLNNKFFTLKQLNEKIMEDFHLKKIVPTGLLPGRKVFRSINEAREIEEKFDDIYIQEKGFRRDAIVFPKNVKIGYNSHEKILSLNFTLPKGSYATVLIENIANKNLNN